MLVSQLTANNVDLKRVFFLSFINMLKHGQNNVIVFKMFKDVIKIYVQYFSVSRLCMCSHMTHINFTGVEKNKNYCNIWSCSSTVSPPEDSADLHEKRLYQFIIYN